MTTIDNFLLNYNQILIILKLCNYAHSGNCVDATGNLSSVFYIGGASGLLSFGLALWMGRIMAHQRQKAKDAEMEEKNLANL